ncbi:MAG TPA: RHS repeat domain-containing protein [Gemmatimonadales bacterium]|nr:RHS repeat domain-containing protein [Gemmatimonadales bacterium]
MVLTRNADADLTRITSPNRRWIELAYDTSHRVTQATDTSGRTVGYTYDGSGRLWKVDVAHRVRIPSPTTREVVVTTPLIPGLEVCIGDVQGRTNGVAPRRHRQWPPPPRAGGVQGGEAGERAGPPTRTPARWGADANAPWTPTSTVRGSIVDGVVNYESSLRLMVNRERPSRLQSVSGGRSRFNLSPRSSRSAGRLDPRTHAICTPPINRACRVR